MASNEVFARAEMFWPHPHPPIEDCLSFRPLGKQVLDPNYVHIPLGQDNNFYNHNPLRGINVPLFISEKDVL